MRASTFSVVVFRSVVLSVLLAGIVRGADVMVLPDYPSQDRYVDTLRYITLAPRNSRFAHWGDVRDVKVLPQEPKAAYSYKLWLQDQPAPLVVLLPGLGGHWASRGTAGLAEPLYQAGFSVAALSSAFNWDFVKNASTMVVPGYTPQDARDVYNVLQHVVADIAKKYGAQRVSDVRLCGFSLGGLHAVFLADLDARERRLNFTRVVAINPPVNLFYCLNTLDYFYSTWTNWPAAELEQRKNAAIKFYHAVMDSGTDLTATNLALPVTGEEAQFAIGYTFRRTLSETIKAIRERATFGILETPLGYTTRFLEKEIERYSYGNYVQTFLKAAYSNEWGRVFTLTNVNLQASLPAVQTTLRSNAKLTVLHNIDDFLLSGYDWRWLRAVLGDKLLLFKT